MIWLILPGGFLIVLVAWLVRAAFTSRRRRQVELDLDLTADEAEQLAKVWRTARENPAAWRRNRLRRHADAQCEGMPALVRRNMEQLIDEAPQRAARVLDDGDGLRQWFAEEGIKQ